MEYINRKERRFRLGRTATIAFVVIFMTYPMFAQTTKDEQVVSETQKDSTNLRLQLEKEEAEKKEGLIKEFLKFFKFRDNRNRKEQERVRALLKELIDSNSLKIETADLERVLKEINQKIEQERLDIDSLKQDAQDKESEIKDNLDSILTSKKELDNLKTRLTALVKDNNGRLSADEKKVIEEIRGRLLILKEVRESCDMDGLEIEEMPLDKDGETGTITFKRCLETEVQVIGWHSAYHKEAYKEYKYEYLSAINLYGYNVTSTGENIKKIDILEFQKTGGVIDKAHEEFTDIHLTVYSNIRRDIHRLIENEAAQQRLFQNLRKLVVDNSMNGINIFFEKLPLNHSAEFVSFIKKLRLEMNKIQSGIQLNITIPAIWNESTRLQSKTYDFDALAEHVNYYFVTTDMMTSMRNNQVQATSPLESKGVERLYSIASTVDYYTNGRLDPKKLIVLLSYEGIEWEVTDFSGSRDRKVNGVRIGYRNIPTLYIDNDAFMHDVVEGYDEDQATSFVNITSICEDDKTVLLKQVWYEDMRSLYEKYSWIKENELGGVGIRELGYDDPSRSGLWDAMGAALVKVDTIDINTEIDLMKKDLDIWEKKKIFVSDWQWSDDANLQYYFDKEKDSIRKCTDSHVKKRVALEELPTIKGEWKAWKTWQPYKPSSERKMKSIYGDSIIKPQTLKSFDECRCLMGRWERYSIILFWIAGICILLIFILKAVVHEYDRYLTGKAKRPILRFAQGLLFLIGLPALLAGIWLAPTNPLVGTNSDGTSRVDIVILGSVIIGLILGWIVRKWMIDGRRKRAMLQ